MTHRKSLSGFIFKNKMVEPINTCSNCGSDMELIIKGAQGRETYEYVCDYCKKHPHKHFMVEDDIAARKFIEELK